MITTPATPMGRYMYPRGSLDVRITNVFSIVTRHTHPPPSQASTEPFVPVNQLSTEQEDTYFGVDTNNIWCHKGGETPMQDELSPESQDAHHPLELFRGWNTTNEVFFFSCKKFFF